MHPNYVPSETHPRYEALDTLGEVSPQSILILDRYKYYEGDDGALGLNIPSTDRELAALTLLNILKGRSCGILYPFPESDFCILPLLGPLAHTLVGRDGFYIVMSRSANWPDIYGRIRKNKTEEPSGLLRHLHPFATMGIDGHPVNRAKTRDSTRAYHLVFSRWKTELNDDYQKQLKGVIIDLGPPRCKIDSVYLERYVTKLTEQDCPVIVVFSNPNGAVPRILARHGIDVMACPWQQGHGTTLQFTQKIGDGFEPQYLRYCHKGDVSEKYPDVEIIKIPGHDELKRLNEALQKILDETKEEEATANEKSFAAYSSYIESLIRNCWTKVDHYEDAASSSFGAEPLVSAKAHIGRTARKIYENNSKIGLLGLEFEEALEKSIISLKTEGSHKSIWLEREINELDKSKDKTLLNYGRIQQKALNIFIEPYLNDGWRLKSVSPYNLSYLERADELLLSGAPLYSQTHILHNSTADRVTVLCYPWEEQSIVKKLNSYRSKLSHWHRNTERFLEEGTKAEKNGKAVSRGVNHGDLHIREPSSIMDKRPATNFEIGTLLDYLENGNGPYQEEGPTSGPAKTFHDTGEGEKWYIKTDLGDMYLNSNRNLMVVYQTCSLPRAPNELKNGNIILVGKDFNPRPMSHYVWEILAKKGIIKEGALWGEWKRRLRHYCETHPGENYHTIFESLKAGGDCGIETASAVYCWLYSDELIGPQDKGSIMAIGKLIGAGKTECDMWWASIEQVRSALRSAYAQLWRLTKYYANNLASGETEDILLSGDLNIWLSDIGDLVDFAKVISQPVLISVRGSTDGA